MKTWITSDTHFGHKNIMKFCPESRPYTDVYEMNKTLVENWNSCVGENDIIYHLGDFAFMSAAMLMSYLDELNGRIRLVHGNHDNVILKNRKVQEYFEWVKPYEEVKINKVRVVLFHYPIAEWNGAHHGSVHFHGHLHSNRVFGRSMDVGCDSNKCMPYNFEELVDYMVDTQEPYTEYHDVKNGN